MDCSSPIKKRNKAYDRYKKTKAIEHAINYKKEKAITQKTIENERRAYWQNYCDQLTDKTKLSTVWRMAKSTTGTRKGINIASLKDGTEIIYDDTAKAELLAKQFSDVSNNKNYSKAFMKRKNFFERKCTTVTPKTHEYTSFLNDDLAHHEMITALTSAKRNTCPVNDNIYYEFLKNLPRSAQSYLLNIFNQLWKSSTFINDWQNSVIIPILKPTQDPTSPQS